MTPFALGMAAAAAIAGRLVPSLGRWLTVIGLATTVIGLVVAALLLPHAAGAATAWTVAAPLLLAGFGGGMVTSPNLTLTLQNVPVAMAGAAGGALQTAQRIGAAVGSAVLVTIFYHQLSQVGDMYPTAISDTLLYAAGFMVLALSLAIVDLARQQGRSRHRELLARARDRSEIAATTNLDVTRDLLYGAINHRLLHGHTPPSQRFAQQLIAAMSAKGPVRRGD